MLRTRALSKAGQRGFSLIEVIVVVAIMAVLGSVLVPQLLRYVNQNRAKACQVDREGILAVYERCIYEGSAVLQTQDLEDIIDRVKPGMDEGTKDEVAQYVKCPNGGNYTGKVVGDLAIIECDCDGHEEVVVDFAAWSGTELAEGIDAPYDPATFPTTPEPPESSSEEESSSTEEEPVESSYWPYWDDPRWVGKQFSGASETIAVPVKFTSREGNTYVVTDRNKTGTFTVHWEWNRGPESIDNLPGEGIISCSGVVITDISTVLYKNINPSDTSGMLTGINYGDILVIDGKEFIYGTLSQDLQIPVPTIDNPGNFHYVGEDHTAK